jgi:hypothetical protein
MPSLRLALVVVLGLLAERSARAADPRGTEQRVERVLNVMRGGQQQEARELGRTVKALARSQREIKSIARGHGAVIALKGTGRGLVVFADKVVIRQTGQRKNVATLVDGRLASWLTPAGRLGARIRKEFPGTTASSVRELFVQFLLKLE